MRMIRAVAATLLSAPLFLSACAAATNSADNTEGPTPVTLTMASSFNSTHSNNDGMRMFLENLTENAPWITIDYKGGPEVMAPNVLIEGVSAGVFDLASLPGDYYVDQMPAMHIPRFTPYTPMEERELGIVDIYDEMHRDQLGITYLGHTVSGMAQVVLLDQPLTEANLHGQSIRTSSATSGIVEGLGGVPVDLPGGEVYTGLERGVVDGATWASVGPSSLGLQEVVNYHLAPRFYESLANLVMHEDTWEDLEPETQEAITQAITETEPDIFEYYLNQVITETEEWEAAGVKENALSPDQADKIFQLAYRDQWEALDWDGILATTPDAIKLKEAYEEGLKGDLSSAVPGGSSIEQIHEKIAQLNEEENS